MIAGLTAVLAAFALLVRFPAEGAAGARQGLEICARVIVPALLPFLICSSLASALGLPSLLARALAPVLTRLGLAPGAAAPLLLGLLGGYPVGAAALAGEVRRGALGPEAASEMLPYCNNTGPGFIVGIAGAAVFGSARLGALLYAAHVLAAFSLALGMRSHRASSAAPAAIGPARLAEALPASVGGAALTAVRICAYVVFFSALTALLRAVGLFAAAAYALHALLHTPLRASYALLSGLLELGSGIGAMEGMEASARSLALAAFLLGFGGLSVHAQTLCAVAGTNIKCARHFAGRILHGALSALYVLFLYTLITRLPI